MLPGNHKEEEVLLESGECRPFNTKFSHRKYDLSPSVNATFFVYVYGFQTPFILKVSVFSQSVSVELSAVSCTSAN